MLFPRHWHIRKRISASLEPFPARTTLKRFLDRVVYAVGVLGPLFTLPQIIKIYSTHSAAGVSIFSWGAFALFDIPWIIYGIVHKERPIVVTYTLWLIFNSVVVVGVLIYSAAPYL